MDISTVGATDTVYSGVPLAGQDVYVCRITNTRVLWAYRDPTDTFLKVRCLEVTGNVVSHAGAVLDGNAFITTVDGVIRITDTRAVVLFRRDSDNYPTGLTVDIATDGTLSIAGTNVLQSFAAARTWGVRLTDTTCLLSWVRTSTSALKTSVCTVGGSGLTVGTIYDIETSLADQSASFTALSSTQVLAAYHYTDVTDGELLRAKVLDISGGVVTTSNTPVTVGLGTGEVTTSFPYLPFLTDFGGGSVGVFYLHRTSFYLVSRILTVTGSSVSASALTTHTSLGDTSQYGYAAAMIPGTTDVMAVCQTPSNVKAVIMSGSSMTYGTIRTVDATADNSRAALAPLTDQRTLYAYSDYVSGSVSDREALLLIYNPAVAGGTNMDLPILQASLYGNYLINAELPMLAVQMVGGPKPSAIDVTLPMLTARIRSGATLRPSLPMLTARLTGTTNFFAELEVILPMVTATMAGTTGRLGALEVALPGISAELRGGGTMDAQLPMFTARISSTVGVVGTITAILPMLTAEMSATEQAHAIIEVILPMLLPSHTGRIVSVLPMLQASLSGGTVIAVTYEAYAVNLDQADDDNATHAVTRYTNFPFNQIVRYQGSYYGVADDGIYLLEGTTDYDATTPTDIPWDWHTHYTDFGSTQKKSVRQMVVGGRLGPTATGKVSVREASDVTYSYTNVRGEVGQNYRIKIGKGLKDRYWSFGLSGVGDGDVETLDFDAAEIGRKL